MLPTLYEFEYGKYQSKCCGNRLYDSSVDFCCDDTVQNKQHPETDCCRGIPYDRSTKICCNGILREVWALLTFCL